MRLTLKILLFFCIYANSAFSFGQLDTLPPQPICPGEKGLIYYVYPNKDPDATYRWVILPEGAGYFVANNSDTIFTDQDTVTVNFYDRSDLDTGYTLKVQVISDLCFGSWSERKINFILGSKINLDTSHLTVCESEIPYKITAPDGFISYTWYITAGIPDTTGRYFDATGSGNIWVTAESPDGCISSDTMQFGITYLSESELPAEYLTCKDTSLSPGEYYDTYLWSDNTISSTYDVHSSSVVEKDTITVYFTQEACGTSDTVVLIPCNQPIEIPNMIFPDELNYENYHWVIKRIENYPNATIAIFDRSGKRIFIKDKGKPYEPWDGTYNGIPLPMDSYHYYIVLNDKDSNVFKGTITIVR